MAASLTLEDRVAISDVFARYAWSLDTRDLDGFAATFAPDGAIQMPGVGRFEGRDEVRRYGKLLTDDPRYPGRQHFIAQSRFDSNGDGARCTVRSYAMVTSRSAEGACSVLSLGYYTDQMVKRDGEWMFAERIFERWGGEILRAFQQPAS